MSVTVVVPTLLRPHSGDRREVVVDGATVEEVIRAVDHLYPGFAGAVMERDGTIKRYLAVFVGDSDVRYLRGTSTPVLEGAEVVILPAVAGGGPL